MSVRDEQDLPGMHTELHNPESERLLEGSDDSVPRNGSVDAKHTGQDLSFVEALRLYPQSVAWSMFFSIGVIMTAYDPQLLGQLFAQPTFRREFGYLFDRQYIIEARWQTGLLMGSPVGQVVGAFFATYPMERFGRKRTLGACVLLTTVFILIQFTAHSLMQLLVGELLGGLVLGTYAVIAPAYASEVCPVALRGILTSYINLCFVIGQLLANGIVAGTHRITTHWAYSAPFASQWLWPLVILCGLPFAPESPWWLVRQGRLRDAEDALHRLSSDRVDVKHLLAEIVHTDHLEQKLEAGTQYQDCFRDINLRRTEIAIGVYSIQVISGIYLVSYTTYFFELAGLSTSLSFDLSIVFLAVGFIATLISWSLLLYLGRRTIYNFGLGSLVILLFAIAIIDCAPGYEQNRLLAQAQAALMIIWNFCYDLSVGPVCFVILCEVSATKLRSKTIAIATAVQATFGIAMTIAVPYLINPDEANLRGKIGFFFGGLSLASLVWAHYKIPETSGRTYEELDVMFSKRIDTRDFRKYICE